MKKSKYLQGFGRHAAAALLALTAPLLAHAQDAGLSSAEKIYADLAKLDPAARQAKIEAGAKAEGALSLIHTWRGELARDHLKLFQAKYPDIKVEFVDIGSQDAAERLLAEETAGRHLTDVVNLSLGDIAGVTQFFARYPTPATKKILPQYAKLIDPENRWVPFYWSEHGISYNSNMLTAEQAPKSWEDLCKPEYKGQISFDPPEVRFLLGMYAVLGADKIEDWIKCIGANEPITQRGHTQRLQLMIAGDHAIQGDNYLYQGMLMKKENPATPFVPVWTAPVHAAGGAIMINKNTPHPYASALWADWVLSDESQKYTSDEYRGPVTIPHPYMPADVKPVIFDSADGSLGNKLLDMWAKYVTQGKK
jgi:iron(III) transport system substrate-binding protein